MEELLPVCKCGKGVRLWSAVDERGYCSEECYRPEAGKSTVVAFKYVGHGKFEAKEADNEH